MNLVKEATRIAEARFAALATSVYAKDPIRASLSWKNKGLSPGSAVRVGYALGTYDPATGYFYYLSFKVDDVIYVCGSSVLSDVPAAGSSKTDSILSYAPNIAQAMTLGGVCFIGIGKLGEYKYDYGQGSRIIGLKWDDYRYYTLYAGKIFGDVLAVIAGVALKAGWNEVVYGGKTQAMKYACASIMPYLSSILWWNTATGKWEQVLSDTIMYTGYTYHLNVIQDCFWSW